MKYYFIEHSLDSKIIGRQFPQSQDDVWPTFIKDYFEEPRSYKNFLFRKAPSNVIVPDFVMRNSAKITDYVNAASANFPIISRKMVNIIDKHKSSNFQWLPTHLLWKETKIGDYFMLNPLFVDYEILDLKKSAFEKIEDCSLMYSPKSVFLPKNYEELSFYDSAIFKSTSKERIEVKSCVINKEAQGDLYYLKNFYVLDLTRYTSGLIISEKIKQELEAAKCTGFDMIEL